MEKACNQTFKSLLSFISLLRTILKLLKTGTKEKGRRGERNREGEGERKERFWLKQHLKQYRGFVETAKNQKHTHTKTQKPL